MLKNARGEEAGGMSDWDEKHWCWSDCCDLGTHACICDNDCKPPKNTNHKRR